VKGVDPVDGESRRFGVDTGRGARARPGAPCPGGFVQEVAVSPKATVRLFAVAALLTPAAVPAAASAADGSAARFSSTTATPQGALTVSVDVRRFRASASGTKADGTATATLGGLGGLPTTVKKKVQLSAAKTGGCTILTLQLDTLDLTLLGLNVHLDKVNLDLTGKRSGGVLGSLFCSLAKAKVKTSRATAARRLNHAIRRTGVVRPISFTVPVQATTSQAAPVCNILELTLGPLHLELLGLVVDLNKVHLTITANPTGGVLGRLFCGLANSGG
jgi:hypothetical protein